MATSRPVTPAEDPEGVDVPETANAAPEPPESVVDPEDDAAILAHAETVAQDMGITLDDDVRQEILEAARNGEFVEDVLDDYAGEEGHLDSDIAIFNSLPEQGFSIYEDDNATETETQPGETADRSEGSGTVPAGARPLDGDRGRSGGPEPVAGRAQGEVVGREAAPDDLTERRERHALYNRIRAGRRPTEDGTRGFSMIQEIILWEQSACIGNYRRVLPRYGNRFRLWRSRETVTTHTRTAPAVWIGVMNRNTGSTTKIVGLRNTSSHSPPRSISRRGSNPSAG